MFTEVEILKSEKRFKRAASYAKRFAAKEAVTKALGTGLSNGVYLKDIGVVNNKYGKPSINLTGGAKKRLKKLLPPKHKAKINITITYELNINKNKYENKHNIQMDIQMNIRMEM